MALEGIDLWVAADGTLYGSTHASLSPTSYFAPRLSGPSPFPGQVASATLYLYVTTSVRLYVPGVVTQLNTYQSTYSATFPLGRGATLGLAAGFYSYTVVAYDSFGNGSSLVEGTFEVVQGPPVSLRSPVVQAGHDDLIVLTLRSATSRYDLTGTSLSFSTSGAIAVTKTQAAGQIAVDDPTSGIAVVAIRASDTAGLPLDSEISWTLTDVTTSVVIASGTLFTIL